VLSCALDPLVVNLALCSRGVPSHNWSHYINGGTHACEEASFGGEVKPGPPTTTSELVRATDANAAKAASESVKRFETLSVQLL
jgi:hypothetical protein